MERKATTRFASDTFCRGSQPIYGLRVIRFIPRPRKVGLFRLKPTLSGGKIKNPV